MKQDELLKWKAYIAKAKIDLQIRLYKAKISMLGDKRNEG